MTTEYGISKSQLNFSVWRLLNFLEISSYVINNIINKYQLIQLRSVSPLSLETV